MKVLAIKNIGIEGTGTFGKYLSGKSGELVTIDLQNGDACPKTTDGFDLVIILGGPMNVYETTKYPFLIDEMKLIEDGLKQEKKMVGFCLGSQLIASALGAKVFKNRAKEIGWYDVSLTDDGKKSHLFLTLPEQFRAFQWHGDTFDLPASALHLAESKLCTNQAFAYKNVVGLQFHIEVEPEDILAWCNAYADELNSEMGEGGKAGIEADTKTDAQVTSNLAEKFYRNLLG